MINRNFRRSQLRTFLTRCLLCVLVPAVCFNAAAASAGEIWEAGFAKIDVTPGEPVRMAGYGSRDRPSEGVDTRLFARCVAIRRAGEDETLVLVSVDNIGLPGVMTRELAATLEKRHGLSRDQVVFCSTHTHSGPDLVSQLATIFAKPLTQQEIAAGERYKKQLHQAILEAVADALDDQAPASLSYGVGEASFAANRRVLTEGRWSGFGVQPDGPVDQSVPVLRITGGDGQVRGLIFNYACHCTTLGGQHYRINGDWAGYAAAELESTFDNAVALSTIGCGADANPNPRGTLQFAQSHGKALAEEVARVANTPMNSVTQPVQTRFDYAALSFELPTKDELRERLEDRKPQVRRHAQNLLKQYEADGRLPATYPVPIQSWKFGDELTMIFLGGEVVVDYAIRLKKLLGDSSLWVTAYANDVMGYVASERMRREGGYEYDTSGIYYGLPGPWASGSEDLLIERVQQMLESRGRSEPLSPEDAETSFQLSEGFDISLVAAEPLIADPINLAFGLDGRLWVVEMGGYPEATGEGRIKVLSDTDDDGVFDEATTFLKGLSFPTGVQPWGDGVLVSAAPDVLYAKDTDGDGKADEIEKLLTGFELSNPQHRVSGFTYGLDDSLHLSSGDNQDEITSVRTGQSVDASGNDLKFWPDTGELEATSGRTQYIRTRDDWGRWFGNSNSRPMFHYPIDESYLQRNTDVSYATNTQQMFDPPVAPPVFPVTTASERFNDLYAANRFTSACSSVVGRAPSFRVGGREVAFICEPVHNLVHRAVLTPDGSSFRASRSDKEQDREFLASSDPWFRPARVAVGPDGCLWVVDMYREVIEHPKWIPQAWQQQLDLYAGHDRGRIYRITPKSKPQRSRLPNVLEAEDAQLFDYLRSPIGALRDMAQRMLLERIASSSEAKSFELRETLRALALQRESAVGQVHAISILDATDWLDAETLADCLRDSDSGVLQVAARLSERHFGEDSSLVLKLIPLASHPDPAVALQAALSLGASDHPAAAEALATIAKRSDLDRWIAMGVCSSASRHAVEVLEAILTALVSTDQGADDVKLDLIADLYTTAASQDKEKEVASLVRSTLDRSGLPFNLKLQVASAIARATQSSVEAESRLADLFQGVRQRAWEVALDVQQPQTLRAASLHLINTGNGQLDEKQHEELLSLLEPTTPAPVQDAAIDCLLGRANSTITQDLVDMWDTFSQSVREHCIQSMLSRSSTTEQLLDFLEQQQLSVNDLSPAARQQLLQSGNRTMKVRAARLIHNTTSEEKETLVREMLDEIDRIDSRSRSGTSERGASLFKKHCATCHLPSGENLAIGPSLDNLSDRSDRALLEAILDPSRSVEPKFQSYVVQTEDGRILVGVIESEVGDSLTLAHADGKRTTVNRGSIAQMKGTGVSLMPEGFERNLSTEDLAAILQSIQK